MAILLSADHILDWIVTYSALHKLGAVAVPLNDRLSPPEVRGILDHAEVTAVVAGGGPRRRGRPADRLPPLPVRGGHGGGSGDRRARVDIEQVMADDDSAFQAPLDADDLADIMYTSGTTGRPKGVAVRHNQVARVPNQLPEWQGTGWLTASPVFTFAGLGFIHNPMKAGMTVLHLPTFDAGRWLAVVERERPPCAFVVPAMAQLLIHHPGFESADLDSLRLLVLGSAPLAPETLRRLQAKLPRRRRAQQLRHDRGWARHLHHGPRGGPDPAGGGGTAHPPGARSGSSTTPGSALPAGEVGEVLTRNPAGHREYYRDPEATARQWEGGWLHTGDLGHLDARRLPLHRGPEEGDDRPRRDERLRRRRGGRPARPPGGGRGGRGRGPPRGARRGRRRLRGPAGPARRPPPGS